MKNLTILLVPTSLLALSACKGASSLGDGDQSGDQASSSSSMLSSSSGTGASGGQGSGGGSSSSSAAGGQGAGGSSSSSGANGGQGGGGSGGSPSSSASSSSTGGAGGCDSAQPIATNLAGPADLDMAGNEIVFVTQGLEFADPMVLDAAVQKVDKAGGAITVLASGVSSANFLTLTATDVVWTGFGDYPDFADGYLAKVPIAGGATTMLAPNETQGYVVANDGVTVFWS